jgi:hypothetical protein
MHHNKTTTILFLSAATACGAAVMLAPRKATADLDESKCDIVDGDLQEDPGGSACPPDHPNCFMGAIEGKKLRATTLFFGEGSVAAPPTSPNWFCYSGVTTYTTPAGTLATRETGLVTNIPIAQSTPPSSRASLSMEVITGGTGEFAGATGYLFVNGFVDPNRHVTSHVFGKVCRP